MRSSVSSLQLSQSAVIVANASISVSGRLTVNADLLVHGNWSLDATAQVNANGTLIINAAVTQMTAGASISSTVLIINPFTALQVTVPQSAILNGATRVVIPVAFFSELHGSFASVSVNNNGVALSSYTLDYTTSSATLTLVLSITTNNNSNNTSLSSGLSGGAIAGIVIGCIAAASLVVLGIIMISQHAAKATDANVNAEIRMHDIALNESVMDMEKHLNKL